MADAISDSFFSGAEGVEDWRVLYWGAKALFRTTDFATGAVFIAEIARVAAEVGHNPLVDLRDESVTVQVITPGVGLSDLDLALARAISESAAAMGLHPDPTAVQQVQLAFDAEHKEEVLEFWRTALGYVRVSESDLVEGTFVGPTAWFQDKAYVAPRNRIHVDVSLPHDIALRRVEAVLAAGGRLLGDRNAPAFWSLIDIDGNVVDIATWQGRD